MKPEKATKAPNILLMTRRFNDVSIKNFHSKLFYLLSFTNQRKFFTNYETDKCTYFVNSAKKFLAKLRELIEKGRKST